MSTLYQICWQSRSGGAVHKGKPLSKTDADSWVIQMNAKHPSIIHWTEPVEVRTELHFQGEAYEMRAK